MKFLPDILAIIGLASLWYGLYLFLPWVSFSVCGSLLIIAGYRLGYAQKLEGDAP